MPDDPKPPIGRPPLTRTPARDFTKPKTATPPGGYPTFPPRQDDVPAVPVPRDFAIERGEITAVTHATQQDELIARARKTQHDTEGAAVVTLNIHGRVGTIESDLKALKSEVGDVKAEVTLVGAKLDAQDQYMKPLVDVLVSGKTLEHAKTKATIEVDTVKQIDEVKAKDAKRERVTAGISAGWKIAAGVIGAITTGGIGAAIHAWLSGAH